MGVQGRRDDHQVHLWVAQNSRQVLTIVDIWAFGPSKVKVPDIDAFDPKQMGQLVDKGQMIAVGALAIADIGQSEGLSGHSIASLS